MQNTIELTPKSTKWIYLFNGVVYTALGVRTILNMDTWVHWSSILAVLLIISGPIFFVYGIILFYPSNKLTPAIQINEAGLRINGGIFKKAIRINWANVQEITFSTFELDFTLDNTTVETINLPTTADKSIEIKQTIRALAEQKEIPIIGG